MNARELVLVLAGWVVVGCVLFLEARAEWRGEGVFRWTSEERGAGRSAAQRPRSSGVSLYDQEEAT